MDVAQLATAAVAILSPYLAKGAEKIAEKLGGDLYERVKAKLTTPASRDALREIEKAPGDADAQGAVRLHLRKVLSEDAGFRQALQDLVTRIERERSHEIRQTATTVGTGITTIQITGSGNEVSVPPRT